MVDETMIDEEAGAMIVEAPIATMIATAAEAPCPVQ